jgi:hypothetical protein
VQGDGGRDVLGRRRGLGLRLRRGGHGPGHAASSFSLVMSSIRFSWVA